jgi:hypothetical protein
LWNLVTNLLALTGRLVAAAVGLVLTIAGVILIALIITAPVGIPLTLFGGLLLVRAIF